MNERPEPPPEGRLITDALKQARPKLSAREAARRAGMSEGRWRQIAQGFQTVSGRHIPVTGPPETVARMAAVVGVSPEQLTEVGREDAAEELRASAGVKPGPAADVPQTWQELRARMDEDPEYAQAVFDLIRTAQRIGGALPAEHAEQEESRRHRDAG